METEIQYCEDCGNCKPFQVTIGRLGHEESIRLADCKAYPLEPTEPVTLGRNIKPETKLQGCKCIRMTEESGDTCSKFKPHQE